MDTTNTISFQLPNIEQSNPIREPPPRLNKGPLNVSNNQDYIVTLHPSKHTIIGQQTQGEASEFSNIKISRRIIPVRQNSREGTERTAQTKESKKNKDTNYPTLALEAQEEKDGTLTTLHPIPSTFPETDFSVQPSIQEINSPPEIIDSETTQTPHILLPAIQDSEITTLQSSLEIKHEDLDRLLNILIDLKQELEHTSAKGAHTSYLANVGKILAFMTGYFFVTANLFGVAGSFLRSEGTLKMLQAIGATLLPGVMYLYSFIKVIKIINNYLGKIEKAGPLQTMVNFKNQIITDIKKSTPLDITCFMLAFALAGYSPLLDSRNAYEGIFALTNTTPDQAPKFIRVWASITSMCNYVLEAFLPCFLLFNLNKTIAGDCKALVTGNSQITQDIKLILQQKDILFALLSEIITNEGKLNLTDKNLYRLKSIKTVIEKIHNEPHLKHYLKVILNGEEYTLSPCGERIKAFIRIVTTGVVIVSSTSGMALAFTASGLNSKIIKDRNTLSEIINHGVNCTNLQQNTNLTRLNGPREITYIASYGAQGYSFAYSIIGFRDASLQMTNLLTSKILPKSVTNFLDKRLGPPINVLSEYSQMHKGCLFFALTILAIGVLCYGSLAFEAGMSYLLYTAISLCVPHIAPSLNIVNLPNEWIPYLGAIVLIVLLLREGSGALYGFIQNFPATRTIRSDAVRESIKEIREKIATEKARQEQEKGEHAIRMNARKTSADDKNNQIISKGETEDLLEQACAPTHNNGPDNKSFFEDYDYQDEEGIFNFKSPYTSTENNDDNEDSSLLKSIIGTAQKSPVNNFDILEDYSLDLLKTK